VLKSFKGSEAYWVWTCISDLGWIAIGPGPVENDPFELSDFFYAVMIHFHSLDKRDQ
jgi:hypothetical protein